MIYSAECDIVAFLGSLIQGLVPYARANEISISFVSKIKKQPVQYHPFLLSQSLIQLVCNIINLLPPKNNIFLRLLPGANDRSLVIEVENSGINLIRVNEIVTQSRYSFTCEGLASGTLYRLVLPFQEKDSSVNDSQPSNGLANQLPQFYKEVQKRFRTHFTQTEKLLAALNENRPSEAVFMQKINAVIQANLDDEDFDTDSLCKAMSLSRTQLFRRVKSLIKQAPAHHIKIMRLQKAKEYLETTDYTISEISFKTGFKNLSHFTKIFKTQYGVLPSIYRINGSGATKE